MMNCVKNVSPVFSFQDKFVLDLISGETWGDISLGGPRTISSWGDLNHWGDLKSLGGPQTPFHTMLGQWSKYSYFTLWLKALHNENLSCIFTSLFASHHIIVNDIVKEY